MSPTDSARLRANHVLTKSCKGRVLRDVQSFQAVLVMETEEPSEEKLFALFRMKLHVIDPTLRQLACS